MPFPPVAPAVCVRALVALLLTCAAAALLAGPAAAAANPRAALVGAQASASPSWRPYSADSPFNVPVGRAPVHPRSRHMVARMLSWGKPADLIVGTSGTRHDYAHPFYFAAAGDPVVRLHATAPWGRNALEGLRIPVPAAAKPAGGDDGHMTVVTPDGWEYDFWQVQDGGPRNGRLTFSWGGRVRIDGDGLHGAATASEFAGMAGIIRPPELAAGEIRHALFLVLRCASGDRSFGHGVRPPYHEASAWVYPAGKGGGRCGPGESDGPPMGARIRLALSPKRIATMPFPRWKKAILTALSRYGGYVGDTGGPGLAVQFESGASWTSFGLADPFVSLARAAGVPSWEGQYALDLASGVNWKRYLRVVLPPRRR